MGIELGKCQCGCGGKTSIIGHNRNSKSLVKGQPRLFLKGHAGRISFEKKFIVADDGCWNWTAAKFKSGYGICYENNKFKRAHRVAYQRYKGEIGDGMHVLHKCDNPGCVNPDHLFLGTHQDNMHDMAKKKRCNPNTLKGDSNPGAKITSVQALAIRSDIRMKNIIAEQYGVSPTLVARIQNRKAWAHL